MGDLETAERELREAVDLHRDVDAPAGEAHSLQRLAEVRLAQGDAAEARRLLQEALPLARWSVIGLHLLQRTYGMMIAAAPDPASARAVVDQAEATVGENDTCLFCTVMLAVPAAIACADTHDLAGARRHLALAEKSAARWDGRAWDAAVLETRAHLARAEGRGPRRRVRLDDGRGGPGLRRMRSPARRGTVPCRRPPGTVCRRPGLTRLERRPWPGTGPGHSV